MAGRHIMPSGTIRPLPSSGGRLLGYLLAVLSIERPRPGLPTLQAALTAPLSRDGVWLALAGRLGLLSSWAGTRQTCRT